jgi:hypothetical protein
MINIKDIIKTKSAIHCQTFTEWIKLLKKIEELYCEAYWHEYGDVHSIIETIWRVYEKETCLDLSMFPQLFYSGSSYFLNNDFNIICFNFVDFNYNEKENKFEESI